MALYSTPEQNPAIWANQNLFGGYLTPKTATPPGGPAAAATPSSTYAVPGGPAFKTPTAAEIAANQNTYSTAALGNYQGLPIIQQQLTGQIPRDVMSQISQVGAERGVATGMPGSPGANAATMKALGLTSLGIQQQGLENLNRAYSTFPQLNPLGISGENLAAWRTASDYQTHALTANAQMELNRKLANISANTRLTEQQRQEAMQAAKNKAYAAALQPFFNGTTTTSTGADAFSGPGSRESNLAAASNDQYNALIDQGFTPEEADAWLGFDKTQGFTYGPSFSPTATLPSNYQYNPYVDPMMTNEYMGTTDTFGTPVPADMYTQIDPWRY